MSRLIITAKDVQVILGVSSGHASRIIRVIKRKNNKEIFFSIFIKCSYILFSSFIHFILYIAYFTDF